MRRRRVITITGLTGMAVLAGCLVDATGDEKRDVTDDDAETQDSDNETHTLTVTATDGTVAGPMVAEITVNGETRIADPETTFELEDGTYTVTGRSEHTWTWRPEEGEVEVEIDGEDEQIDLIFFPDYPEVDHAERVVRRGEENGCKVIVASGTTENNTDEETPRFYIQVTLYGTDGEELFTQQRTGGSDPFHIAAGDVLDWEIEVMDETEPGFEDVDTENYDISFHDMTEGLPFSELEVRNEKEQTEEDG